MAALLSHTANMLADPFHEGIEHGLDVIRDGEAFTNTWATGKTAARLFERGLQMSLGEDFFWQAVQRLSVLRKRRGILTRRSLYGSKPRPTATLCLRRTGQVLRTQAQRPQGRAGMDEDGTQADPRRRPARKHS